MTRSLLTVFAHPDDEAFITGGLLALCADRGIPTFALTLTRGDAGRAGGLAATREELAAVRTAEFAAACASLGVREHATFAYGDGELAKAPFDDAVRGVVGFIRRWRPTVVVTFGREGGGNAHRDHRAICRIATVAVLAAGDALCYEEQLVDGGEPFPVSKLYHASAREGLVARDGTPFERPTTVIDIANVVARKRAAFLVHASQQSLLPRLDEWIANNHDAEYYTRVLSRVPVPPGIERDLFEGIED